MYKLFLILLGLYLDGFVYMMQTGATVKDLTIKKMAGYSLLYTVVACGMAMIGYGAAHLFKDLMSYSVEIFVASLIIFFAGIGMIWRAIWSKDSYEEKLDRDFNIKKLFRTALYTNIDTLLIGASFSFIGTGAWIALGLFALVGYIIVFIALSIGYNLGASYQRQVQIAGGALMAVFAVWIFANYVLM